jgi:hypothetical protein
VFLISLIVFIGKRQFKKELWRTYVTAPFLQTKRCHRSSFFGNKRKSQKFEKQFSWFPSYFLKLTTSVTTSFCLWNWVS